MKGPQRWALSLLVAFAVVSGADRTVGAVEGKSAQPPRYLGVIEGFYGEPWSHRDRRSMIRWIGRHGMNTYVYAPKDDPFQRQRWRELYPAEDAARIRELAQLAQDMRARFMYSISPGLDMCHSSPGEREALLRKLEQVRSLGIRSFMLAFDDIPRSFHCGEDQAAYGLGDAALGRAHADISNLVYRWIAGGRLVVVPSDYSEVVRTAYLQALVPRLPNEIDLVWTGPYVVPSRISLADARAVARVYGRPAVLWDNYPVNDFARRDLHLGPVNGRAPTLPLHLRGFLANPMNEAEASKLPLYTVAEYLRNGRRYQPEKAWEAAVKELGGSRGAAALRRLAENSRAASTLDDPRPIWSDDSRADWKRAILLARSLRGPHWRDRLVSADRRLRVEWRTFLELPRLVGKALSEELDPWARALAANDDLGRAALRYIAATRPVFLGVRVRRDGGRWEVSGRVISPNRAELARLESDLAVAAAAVARTQKETHNGSTLFLYGLAFARKSCTPTPVRTSLDGRAVRTRRDGRFLAASARKPKRLMARDRRGLGTAHDLVMTRSSVPVASAAGGRTRRQVDARLKAIAAAVRREDLGALRRYHEGSAASQAWQGLLAVSRFGFARFPLAAFDDGAVRCGGPVVAAVPWRLAGQVPPGITIGKGGSGTLGRPTVLLFSNRGSVGAADWRITHAMPFLPYPNAVE